MGFYRNLLTGLFTIASSAQTFGQAPTGVGGNPPTSATAPGTASPPAQPAAPALSPTLTQPLTPTPTKGTLPFANASFEEPVVTKRTSNMDGGSPAAIPESDWAHLSRAKGEGDGALNLGLTNEIARTGKQSLYVDFAGISGKRFTGALMTRLIPVQPGQVYKVGMWGRMNKERPLTLDQRRPYMRMEFEFYQADEETQVGDTDDRVVRIPGSAKRILFSSMRWSEAYGVARAPKNAALMKVAFVFNVPSEPGTTDGMLYFDDASVEQLPSEFPIQASDEITVEEAGDAGTADSPPETAPAAGATPPTPAPEQPK